VDITSGRSIGYPLLNALNRDGIAIYEAERHAEAEFRTRGPLQLSLDRPWYERMRDGYLDHLAAERETPVLDLDVIEAKLRALTDRIGRVRDHRPAFADALAADRDVLDLVSFNLMLAVQACTDIASHLIADEGWPPAKDLADAFHRLHEHGVIAEETSQALVRATGLRNIVTHIDAQADPELVFRVATSGLEDLERFSREVAGWVQEQGRR